MEFRLPVYFVTNQDISRSTVMEIILSVFNWYNYLQLDSQASLNNLTWTVVEAI